MAVASVTETGGASPAAAGGAAGKGGVGGNVTMSTTVSSLANLKVVAPQVYNIMMESIAMDICTQMQQAQDTLKQMWDDAKSFIIYAGTSTIFKAFI